MPPTPSSPVGLTRSPRATPQNNHPNPSAGRNCRDRSCRRRPCNSRLAQDGRERLLRGRSPFANRRRWSKRRSSTAASPTSTPRVMDCRPARRNSSRVKRTPRLGQLVDIRRDGLLVAAQIADPMVQVVHGDHQDIGTRHRPRWPRRPSLAIAGQCPRLEFFHGICYRRCSFRKSATCPILAARSGVVGLKDAGLASRY